MAAKLVMSFLPLVVFALTIDVAVWRAAGDFCFHHEDLGIYSEAIARLSLSSWNPFLAARHIHIFNDHFDPVIIVAAPLRLVMAPWQAALLTELAFVTIACAACAWLSRRLSWTTTLLVTVLIVFEPAVVRAVRFPVHPTTWAMAPMMVVVVALLERRSTWLLVGLAVLFACKEEFPYFGLALGAALVVTGERRDGLRVMALSVAWLAFALVLRARLLGPTTDYGASIFAGLADDPFLYFERRLTAEGLSSGLWDFVAPLLPVAVWSLLKRTKLPWPLFVAVLPLLAIRFFGMAWRHHYLAPLVPIAIGAIVLIDARAKIPRWCVAATLAIIVALDFASLRFAASRWTSAIVAAPRLLPERVAALNDASAVLRANPEGNALVEGNLFTKLAERGNVYVTGNFQPQHARYRYVLFEKPGHGDPYPHDYPWIGGLIEVARSQASQVLVDTEHVFFAEGDFEL